MFLISKEFNCETIFLEVSESLKPNSSPFTW
ncbi:uncharacterized protein METZ01_LOCUS266795, partial [marine metagenome]